MAPDSFAPLRLRLPVRPSPAPTTMDPPPLPRPAKGELYLGGPIPMSWVERAAGLPGRAWHLACALWFQATVTPPRSATVELAKKTRRRFGLQSRKTYYRALRSLEGAGLVRVEYRPGRPPLVTILSALDARDLAETPG